MSIYFEPFDLIDRFFENALTPLQQQQQQLLQGTEPSAGLTTVRRPRLDLHEDSEKNVVTATFELPGLKKEEVNLDIQEGRLIVSGESKSSAEHDDSGYAVRERRFGKFSRTLRLPRGIKEQEVKASLADGVLTVTFPKAAPETAARRIAIA